MARTTPREWPGDVLDITPEMGERIYEQYKVALADEDKAGDVDSMSYYEGWRESLEWVLDMLHGIDNMTLSEALKAKFEGADNGRS